MARHSPLKKFERWGRRVLARCVDFILRQGPQDPLCGGTPTKILVLRFDKRVGNLLLLSPMLATLERLFPEATLDMVVHADMERVLRANPHLDSIYCLRKWTLLSKTGWPHLLWHLRRRSYQLIIDAAHPTSLSLTHALLARLVQKRGAHLIGAVRHQLKKIYSCPIEIPVQLQQERLQYLHLLHRLGSVPTTPPPLRYYPTKKVDCDCGADPFVLLNLGAGSPEKQLPRDFYRQLASRLVGLGWRVIIAHGPAEQGAAQALVAACAKPRVELAPKTDLDELAAWMSAARAVIANDTGPMHLAVATGTPTLAIFCSSDPARFGHDYPPHRVLELPATQAEDSWPFQVIEEFVGRP